MHRILKEFFRPPLWKRHHLCLDVHKSLLLCAPPPPFPWDLRHPFTRMCQQPSGLHGGGQFIKGKIYKREPREPIVCFTLRVQGPGMSTNSFPCDPESLFAAVGNVSPVILLKARILTLVLRKHTQARGWVRPLLKGSFCINGVRSASASLRHSTVQRGSALPVSPPCHCLLCREKMRRLFTHPKHCFCQSPLLALGDIQISLSKALALKDPVLS